MSRILTLLVLLAFSFAAPAETTAPAKPYPPGKKNEKVEPGPVKITQAWARTTAPGATTGAVYMKLESSVPVKLLQAESQVSKSAQIHESKMENGVMQMREAVPLDIPAGKPMVFKPNGYHVMLLDLKKPIKSGDLVQVILAFVGTDNKVFHTTVAAIGGEQAPK